MNFCGKLPDYVDEQVDHARVLPKRLVVVTVLEKKRNPLFF